MTVCVLLLNLELHQLTSDESLPKLPDSAIQLRRHPNAVNPITDCLAEHIAKAFEISGK